MTEASKTSPVVSQIELMLGCLVFVVPIAILVSLWLYPFAYLGFWAKLSVTLVSLPLSFVVIGALAANMSKRNMTRDAEIEAALDKLESQIGEAASYCDAGEFDKAALVITEILNLPTPDFEKVDGLKEIAASLGLLPEMPATLRERSRKVNPIPETAPYIEACHECGAFALGLGLGAYVFHSPNPCHLASNSCVWTKTSLKYASQTLGGMETLLRLLRQHVRDLPEVVRLTPKVQSIARELGVP